MSSVVSKDHYYCASYAEFKVEDTLITVAEGEKVLGWSKNYFYLVDQDPPHEGNWLWNGESFVELIPAKPEVPPVVSMRQAKIALVMSDPINAIGSNALESITQTIDGLPEPDRTVAKITWEYAVDVERSNPLIEQVAAMLSLSNDDIDALFIKAAGF